MIEIMSTTGEDICANCGEPITRLVGDMERGLGHWSHNPRADDGVYRRECKGAPVATPIRAGERNAVMAETEVWPDLTDDEAEAMSKAWQMGLFNTNIAVRRILGARLAAVRGPVGGESGLRAAAEALADEWNDTWRHLEHLAGMGAGVNAYQFCETDLRAAIAAALPAPVGEGDGAAADRDAGLRERVEALIRNPDGEREWENQGRSGRCAVVDVSKLRAALDRTDGAL